MIKGNKYTGRMIYEENSESVFYVTSLLHNLNNYRFHYLFIRINLNLTNIITDIHKCDYKR